MRRFLAVWVLLSPAYLLAVAVSSYLLLHVVDLTYEAYAAWLLVPVAQAAALAARGLRRPLLPTGRPPLSALVPVALALATVAAGFLRPSDVRLGFLGPGSLQALVPRALAFLAGAAFLAASRRPGSGRTRIGAVGLLLLLLGLDAAHAWIAPLPATLLPRVGLLPGGAVVWGALAALVFALALAAQAPLERERPWAARLLGASLAFLFGALHGALLQLFLHPWLERPWAFLVPAAVTLSASLAAAAGLASLTAGAEGP